MSKYLIKNVWSNKKPVQETHRRSAGRRGAVFGFSTARISSRLHAGGTAFRRLFARTGAIGIHYGGVRATHDRGLDSPLAQTCLAQIARRLENAGTPAASRWRADFHSTPKSSDAIAAGLCEDLLWGTPPSLARRCIRRAKRPGPNACRTSCGRNPLSIEAGT